MATRKSTLGPRVVTYALAQVLSFQTMPAISTR